MKQEYKVSQTVCDACGKVKEEPGTIAGRYDSGWREINDKDLCMVCAGMLTYKMISYLQDSDVLEGIVNKLVKETTPYNPLSAGTTLC